MTSYHPNYGDFPLTDDVNYSKSTLSLYNLEQAFKKRHELIKKLPNELLLEVFSYLLPEISFRNSIYTISNLPLPNNEKIIHTQIIEINSCLDDFNNLDRHIPCIPSHSTMILTKIIDKPNYCLKEDLLKLIESRKDEII